MRAALVSIPMVIVSYLEDMRTNAQRELGNLGACRCGKTTLTERLLFTAGVIDEIGSIGDGSTQTDTLELERQRGITIKSAVASFSVGGVTVNLIDTPGHPDFIAEVERALSVLDGAVLVVSAVEGVQAQTRVLMRSLRRLRPVPPRAPCRRARPRAARPGPAWCGPGRTGGSRAVLPAPGTHPGGEGAPAAATAAGAEPR
jgi:small GTP-binding protein